MDFDFILKFRGLEDDISSDLNFCKSFYKAIRLDHLFVGCFG